jgi:CBS domain-containing protein
MTAKRGFLEARLAGEQQVLARPLRALVQKAPVTCRGDISVRSAMSLMDERGVGSLVVVDEGAKPTGVFTTTDLVRSAAHDIEVRRVADAMSTEPFALPGHAMGLRGRARDDRPAHPPRARRR